MFEDFRTTWKHNSTLRTIFDIFNIKHRSQEEEVYHISGEVSINVWSSGHCKSTLLCQKNDNFQSSHPRPQSTGIHLSIPKMIDPWPPNSLATQPLSSHCQIATIDYALVHLSLMPSHTTHAQFFSCVIICFVECFLKFLWINTIMRCHVHSMPSKILQFQISNILH